MFIQDDLMVQMSFSPKLVYRFRAVLNKIPMGIFGKLDKLILK